MRTDRVRTTCKVEARGLGTVYEFIEDVKPGDTMTVVIDLPLVLEVNGEPKFLFYRGKYLRIVDNA